MHSLLFKHFNALMVVIILFLPACNHKPGANDRSKSLPEEEVKTYTFKRILEEGKISAITDYNSTNYFIYKGQPMGFQYELVKAFADHLKVNLEVGVSNDLEKTFACLTRQGCDLIALDLTVTKERAQLFDFTIPHSQSKQVLIQRKPKGWQKMNTKELEKKLIRNQLDLAGLKIYVQKNSSFVNRLKNLSEEIGDTIIVIEAEDLSSEQLISRVASGHIDYTVCDEHVAMVNATYYNNIDIKTAVSFPQNLAWAVHKGSDELLEEINSWLSDFKKTRKYRALYNKYFKNPKSVEIVESELYSLKGGKISKYDKYIKKYAKEIGWDWRLIASLIYQESRFHPEVRSWAGAFGLMQLMPQTASRFGADTNSTPEQQIKAGIGYLQYLDNQLMDKIPEVNERTYFVLASYNAGLGHILDACRLAEKYGKDSNTWADNVDTFVLLKSHPKYYNDPVVKHGYSRGEESYKFVKEIMERYALYKTVIPQ